MSKGFYIGVNMELKFLKSIRPVVRKRDNEVLTHTISVPMSEPEAIALSNYLSNLKPHTPTKSLIRAFLLRQTINPIDNQFLIELMASLKTLDTLTTKLSQSDCAKALHLLAQSKLTKKDLHKSTSDSRRVYIPEPQRSNFNKKKL